MKNDFSSDLEFIVLVARHGSLSAAARALDITPPAATKRLTLIEERLGVRLLNRTTRSASLTQEGETYLAHATRILEQLNEMKEAVTRSSSELRGQLVINATLGFGRTTIAPLASEFARLHPHVEVDIELTDRPVDLIEGRIDMAIRFGELPDKRLNARRLMSNRRFLCASPLYLERHGEPRTLADLMYHRCIIHKQNDDAYGIWRFMHDQHNEVMKVKGAMASNDGDIVLGWALDGHGILIRSEWDLAKYLESGRLQVVLPAFNPPSADLYVYYLNKKNQSARARAFIDFLADKFRKRKASNLPMPAL
ncbi:LysR family transcriptional regulator [Herbaspirillum sp. BH-1]|uniref:DNA-binding transcriptional LysR family regulator n=1 Tax=Herbaspirillum frisingense TaxID=92645 RepID=A0ABU1PGX7_9BURK|nr:MULTISPECIES: LysR family transcriptional regulator [Herbaspirillum]MDR6585200.1 DNA-binding transcriptional LysR family regulator [Herbaspirillum frisingense]PLY57200.1 LysR family transcriptional regulator [Herbaspirillum sp. BH-1]